MSAPNEIDFARYAEVSAYLRYFPGDKRDEVTGRLGHVPRAWGEAAARWSAARDAELADGRADLTRRFGDIVSRTLARLSLERPSLEALGPLPPPEEPPPDPAAADAIAPLEPIAPPEVQRSSAQLGLEPPRALPSFMVRPALTPSTPVLVEAAPPRVVPASVRLAGTLPLGAALPIAELPFQQAPAERALENALAHALAVQGPAREGAARGATVAVGAPSDVVVAAPKGCPELTVQQYASLRVELHFAPASADPILGKYGVPAASRDDLHEHWRARFDADPVLRMEFARAYATYLGWKRQQDPRAG